jgi:hypothetical protein
MREKIESSEGLRDRILTDEKLLRDLSKRIAAILEGKVEIFTGPAIDSFRPIRGHPGTVLVIKGRNFAPERGENYVTVGGAPAHVVEASLTRLKVITSYPTLTGAVEVRVGAHHATGPVDFEALGWPDPTLEEDGPPILYTGVGRGVDQDIPSKGTGRVLVVLCQANNLTPPNPVVVRNDIINAFDNVHAYYDQVSYGALDVQVDVTTNWRTLDGAFNDFMDTPNDNLYTSKLPQIIAEAAKQAVDEGFDLNNYDLIAAVVYTNRFIRCWGGGATSQFQYNNGSGINIDIRTDHALSTIWINETANWGRCAHEVGHCIVDLPGNLRAWDQALIMAEDVYESDLVDPAAATAYEFDMMGHHDNHPLFSAYYMEQMEYYDPSNIQERQWDRNTFSETFEIVAHGETQNTLGTRCHLVKIRVTEGLYYYVEVRQRPNPSAATPRVFDEHIPLDGATHQGGVVVTKVLTDTVNMNQQMRFITLLHDTHVLKQGDVATDPARYLEITVEDEDVVEQPLTCRVRVEWAQVIGDTPGGDFDLRVEPWNANYETTDIWIDRPPYGVFDYTDPTTGEPIGNGDRPRPLDLNRLYGRVHCDGAVDASNVRVTFYAVTPPGVGDNGNWGPLRTVEIPTIPHGDAREAQVIWVPAVGEHTCLKIYVEPQAGEVNAGGNNSAQENVFNFEAAASSIPDPLVIPVAVRNPLKERTIALISVRNVPRGFIAHFPNAWVWLDPLQERRVALTVIPTRDYSDYKKMEIPHANIKVDGWIPRSYKKVESSVYPASCFMPMGGILTQVTPKRKVDMRIWEDKEKYQPYVAAVRGELNPAMSGEKVIVDLKDPIGRRRVVQVTTDGSGRFAAIFNLKQKPSLEAEPKFEEEEPLLGVYMACAFIVNSPHAAQAESNVVYLVKR